MTNFDSVPLEVHGDEMQYWVLDHIVTTVDKPVRGLADTMSKLSVKRTPKLGASDRAGIDRTTYQSSAMPLDEGSSAFINTLNPRQKGRQFADDTFKCIFVSENSSISYEIHWEMFLWWIIPRTHLCVTRSQSIMMFSFKSYWRCVSNGSCNVLPLMPSSAKSLPAPGMIQTFGILHTPETPI